MRHVLKFAVILGLISVIGYIAWDPGKSEEIDSEHHQFLSPYLTAPSPSHNPLPPKAVPDPKPTKTRRPLVSDPV